MYRFFVNPEQILDNEICITGKDVNHIKNVLRLKIDDCFEDEDRRTSSDK